MERNQQEKIKVTLLANAAVLLEFQGTKLLVDGIYDERGHSFSNLSGEQWEGMKAGTGIFSGIDYLLFTHEHGDHFSPERVAQYLDTQRPKAIFMPKEGSGALRALREKAEEMEIPCALLEENLCRKTLFKPQEDIQIKAYATRHLDELYWNVPHFCYLLELGGKRLLITADVDFTYEAFPDLKGIILDVVFLNPLMRYSREGKRLFSDGMLQTKRKVIYHIPFEGEDAMQIRQLVERNLQCREGCTEEKGVVFLMERGQVCYL